MRLAFEWIDSVKQMLSPTQVGLTQSVEGLNATNLFMYINRVVCVHVCVLFLLVLLSRIIPPLRKARKKAYGGRTQPGPGGQGGFSQEVLTSWGIRDGQQLTRCRGGAPGTHNSMCKGTEVRR